MQKPCIDGQSETLLPKLPVFAPGQNTWDVEHRKHTENVQKTTQKNCGENCGTVQIIIAAIKSNPSITQKKLVEITGLTRRGIEWQIKQLKEKGVIRRIGADKGGYWEIVA